jgi:uncharacterized protein (TIGR00661 family)
MSEKILEIAKKESDTNFIAYGLKETDLKIPNVEFKPPSTDGFLEDLANSTGVITNGGYTLMSEALFFGKPVYSIPIKGQFEQMINGYYLEKEHYGLFDLDPTKERIEYFLDHIDGFTKKINRDHKKFNGNKELFSKLDKIINEHQN